MPRPAQSPPPGPSGGSFAETRQCGRGPELAGPGLGSWKGARHLGAVACGSQARQSGWPAPRHVETSGLSSALTALLPLTAGRGRAWAPRPGLCVRTRAPAGCSLSDWGRGWAGVVEGLGVRVRVPASFSCPGLAGPAIGQLGAGQGAQDCGWGTRGHGDLPSVQAWRALGSTRPGGRAPLGAAGRPGARGRGVSCFPRAVT